MTVQLILQSADLEELRCAAAFGFIDSVWLPRKEMAARAYQERVRAVAALGFSRIMIELDALDVDGMIKELELHVVDTDAKMIGAGSFTIELCRAARHMQSLDGVLNCGVAALHIANVAQGIAAARAGCSALCVDGARFADVGMDPFRFLRALRSVQREGFPRIYLEGMHDSMSTLQASEAGADGLILPFLPLLHSMDHPVTEAGMRRILTHWKSD